MHKIKNWLDYVTQKSNNQQKERKIMKENISKQKRKERKPNLLGLLPISKKQ
jgi:hypothetical protein